MPVCYPLRRILLHLTEGQERVWQEEIKEALVRLLSDLTEKHSSNPRPKSSGSIKCFSTSTRYSQPFEARPRIPFEPFSIQDNLS